MEYYLVMFAIIGICGHFHYEWVQKQDRLKEEQKREAKKP